MKTSTFSAIADPDGIKTSIATAITPQIYEGGALNGALAAAQPIARTVSVTSSAAAGAYVADSPVTFTGTNELGQLATETLRLTAANGGETIAGEQPFRTVTKIEVAAQADTDGALTFGFQDLATSDDRAAILGFRAGAQGSVDVVYRDGSADSIPMLEGERLELAFAGFGAAYRHTGPEVDFRLEVAAIRGTSTALPLTVFRR